jgi:hypothetical protein
MAQPRGKNMIDMAQADRTLRINNSASDVRPFAVVHEKTGAVMWSGIGWREALVQLHLAGFDGHRITRLR